MERRPADSERKLRAANGHAAEGACVSSPGCFLEGIRLASTLQYEPSRLIREVEVRLAASTQRDR